MYIYFLLKDDTKWRKPELYGSEHGVALPVLPLPPLLVAIINTPFTRPSADTARGVFLPCKTDGYIGHTRNSL